MKLRTLAVVPALLVAASSMLWAQTVAKAEVQKASVTIQAPPEVTRFNELKVGDRVNLTNAESLVFQLRQPGAASQQPSETRAAAASPRRSA